MGQKIEIVCFVFIYLFIGVRHSLLDLGNGLSRIEVLRADLGAVHDGVAPVELEGVVEVVQPRRRADRQFVSSGRPRMLDGKPGGVGPRGQGGWHTGVFQRGHEGMGPRGMQVRRRLVQLLSGTGGIAAQRSRWNRKGLEIAASAVGKRRYRWPIVDNSPSSIAGRSAGCPGTRRRHDATPLGPSIESGIFGTETQRSPAILENDTGRRNKGSSCSIITPVKLNQRRSH
jgi:hypothetical protein